MGVRPNITSLALNGTDLIVRGESDDPLPTILQVVVVQDGATEDGRGFEVAGGGARSIVLGWRATFKDTTFKKGPAEVMGIEIRIDPFDIRSWVQSPGHRMTRHGAGPDAPGGRFGVLVPGLKPCRAGEPEIDALVKVLLARAGVKLGTIPAGFTYLGQFIDHDITFDPTPAGARPRRPGRTVNHRTPRLDLDSLYGGGPDLQPYLYEHDAPHRLLLTPGPPLDLPRNHEDVALIGDPRNDENAIISQLHLLFARFHNRIADDLGSFEKARKRVLRHYHWIVLNDYLPKVLGGPFKGPRKHFRPKGEPFIPVEFSGAAYRFGHSMVKPDYEIEPPRVPPPLIGLKGVPLFPFLQGFRKLETERVISWERFFATTDALPQDGSAIDTRLAGVLFKLPFDGEPALARRTLLRGIKLGLPSGQRLATELGVPALDEKDLLLDDVPEPARALLARSTPLWYWILCEAQKAEGKHLGPLGALIVGEVLTGLIETDPTSFVNREAGLGARHPRRDAGHVLDGLARALRAGRRAVLTDYPR